MVFKVGETVVYPHHGAALIEEINTRTIKGEDKLYLKLKVAQGDLTIEVPAENCDLVGVRDVVGQEGLDKVFEVLRAPHTEEPTNWSRRYKANLEKLASGDVIKVAEVVRDLWRRDKDRGLSAGEKRMLAKARQILVSELALAVRAVDHVVVVAPASHLEEARAIAAASARPGIVDVVAGGSDRSASVAAGLGVLWSADEVVLVHDAARALAPPELFDAVIDAVRSGRPAVVPGLPVADTVKAVDASGVVVATPERDALRAVQTPQAFARQVLERAHASGASASDDAGLVERIGGQVVVIPGDARAMKVTTAHDLAVAAVFLREE